MNKGTLIAYLICFIIGIVYGINIGIIIATKHSILIRKNRKNIVKLAEERKTDLIERMLDIFEENKLDIDEIASIIRNANIENERTIKASNQIANMMLEEKLTIAESTDLFNLCYDSLFYS
jgi:hypothetical protein